MKKNKEIELAFSKLGHFWLDSGLVGLIKILEDEDNNEIRLIQTDNQFILKGSIEKVQACLERAYDSLIKTYYNLSTKKQKDTKNSYNFYYDSEKDDFIAFPKKRSAGISAVIFGKAARPTGTSVKWIKKEKKTIVVNDKEIKKTRGLLPESHQHFQTRMDNFLDANELDVTTAGLLVDGENQIRPKVKIKVSPGKARGKCCLCGEASHALEDINTTVFPLITGTSGVLSFYSQSRKPEKVCWKCAFLGKFVPVNGFYYSQGDNIFVFLPYSVSLEKMTDVWGALQESRYDDPNLFKNFDLLLGGYFQRPFEVSLAFLHNLYLKLIRKQQSEQEDEFTVLDIEELFNIALSKAPLEFYVIHLESKGQTKMCKSVWPFRDSVYLFRLLNEIESHKIQLKELMRLLIDFSRDKNEDKTILRNRVCERIFKKQTVLDLIERHVFHSDINYIKPILDFITVYEPIIKPEDGMNKEEQETAVALGRRLGMSVGKDGKKGDLFALRKSRTKIDFLEQLNRLQFKLGGSLTVPPGVYDGKLTDDNFSEFKQFCMIAAVNSFNAATSSGPKKGE